MFQGDTSAPVGTDPEPAEFPQRQLPQRRGGVRRRSESARELSLKTPTLLGVGGAHVDRRGRMAAPFVPGASNPGTMREEAGGGALNALRNARRHGVAAAIVSLRGGDAAGETVAATIAEAGITDLSAVFLDRTTPSYTAILDDRGELVAGLADMGLYELAFERHLKRLAFREAAAEADALLCDANMPERAIGVLAEAAGRKPVFAIAISPAKAVRLTPHLGRLSCLFMNRREAAALTGTEGVEALDALRAMGLASAVVTAGGDSLIGYDGDGPFRVVPPAPSEIIDVTGAGDALAGVTTAHLMNGLPLRQAVRRGMAAALLTVADQQAVAAPSDGEFAAALALVPEAEPVR